MSQRQLYIPSLDLMPCMQPFYTPSDWYLDVLAGVQFFVSTEVHLLVEQGYNIGIEGLPVWVIKVILLALQDGHPLASVQPIAIAKGLTLSFSNRSTIENARGSWTSCITSPIQQEIKVSKTFGHLRIARCPRRGGTLRRFDAIVGPQTSAEQAGAG